MRKALAKIMIMNVAGKIGALPVRTDYSRFQSNFQWTGQLARILVAGRVRQGRSRGG